MDESILISYEIKRIDASGIVRKYSFSHPYGAPSVQTFEALAEIKNFIEVRVAELQNAVNPTQAAIPSDEVTSGN